jgi:signal transduction histidine kinase
MTHTMVHDLRNPLGAIYASLKFMEEDKTKLPADQQQVLDIALYHTNKMMGLVNSILDVNRLESGQMPINWTKWEIHPLVADVLTAQLPLAKEKTIRLESALPPALPPAWADQDLIARVLQNLIGNALKFTPAGGAIYVQAAAEKRDSRTALLVTVRDTGPGIPPEIQNRLFQKFVTGRVQGRGSGLGLAFCKLALEAHGEHIEVASSSAGTTFTFTLPVAPA